MARFDWLAARPVAHRGYHDRAAGRIENTLTAIGAAAERNFAIEVDLQLTADGRVIVFHDDTLERLTENGTGAVDRLTLAQIQALKLRDTDDRVPTLEDMLDLVRGRVPLVIELKSKFNGDRRLEPQVARILATYPGRAAVMSFDPQTMREMRRLAPNLPRGMIADRFDSAEDRATMPSAYRFALRHLLMAPLVAPTFVAYHVGSLPANAPLLLRHLGLKLLTWTVRTPADRATAKRWADQIIFEGFDPDAP